MEAVYRAVIGAIRAVFVALGLRVEVSGVEHLPRQGGAVLAANHVSYLDFALVGYAGRQRGRFVRFVAKSAIFEVPLVGALMRGMRHIPVERPHGAGALLRARRMLARGEVVGIFAEATISRSWLVKPLAPGAAAMAIATGVPLLPVATFGGHRVVTVDGRFSLRRRTPVVIRVGEPLRPGPDDDPGEVSLALRARLEELLHDAISSYPRPDGVRAWWLPHSWGGSAPHPDVAARLDAAALARIAARRARRERRR